MEIIRKIFLTSLVVFFCSGLQAQGLRANDIGINAYDLGSCFQVVSVENFTNKEITIRFLDEYKNRRYGPFSIQPKGKRNKFPEKIICNRIQASIAEGGEFIDIKHRPKLEELPSPEVVKEQSAQKHTSKQTGAITNITTLPNINTSPKTFFSVDDVISDFINYMESIPFLSQSSIEEEERTIKEHINSLKHWNEKDAYIKEHHLNSYVKSCRDSITSYKEYKTTSLIIDYLEKYSNADISDKNICKDSIQSLIKDRIAQREACVNQLANEIDHSENSETLDWKNKNWRRVCIGAGFALLFAIILFWIKKVSKKNRTTSLSNVEKSSKDAATDIVVRRKTTSILRKQNLDDVIDNNAYLVVNCCDFCNDSAVRKMYIKNTCIKDIYNMYAEDLRNPNTPKEDGCMVLGRWVHDVESNEYYVSLEHIVLPGDDAVFAEYELNFGGKIKLKVTEKLRKLRRETNLQYDLTCWVHSHPGLGVFFSNSDSNVQMQLKHPTHPNFLTAIVVDILTPQQEMGIFTFKRDSSINSKADLKKMYSLEELYKWAVESDRNTFKPEDYYNTLANARKNNSSCSGIQLSNGAIIDMGKLAAEESTGFVGLVHGFANQQGVKTENVAVTVTKNEAVPDNELVGCFIMATHCSIPTIRKAIAGYVNRIKFVLIYTSADGLLTSIPIINQDICTDENFYGEQKLEELKIWTRRKRLS